LGQIAFPARTSPAAASAGAASSFAAAGNLAQLMRGVTFPNANILFNVQVKDPAKDKPAMPVPFDYILWGSTVYYGWQAVDQAALMLVETTPLFLLPGRRCENGRPVPVDRADWKQYTAALMDAKVAHKAAQSRNVDAVNKVAEQLNETCANRQVYRDACAKAHGRRQPVSVLRHAEAPSRAAPTAIGPTTVRFPARRIPLVQSTGRRRLDEHRANCGSRRKHFEHPPDEMTCLLDRSVASWSVTSHARSHRRRDGRREDVTDPTHSPRPE
jgi:hypothetical protein